MEQHRLKKYQQSSGVLLRGFAKESEDAQHVAEKLCRSVDRVRTAGMLPVVLIPSDKDCGKTKGALLTLLKDPGVPVLEVAGNQNSVVLNQGLDVLEEERKQFSFIISNKAIEYLTPGNITKMFGAMWNLSSVSGLAIRDTRKPIEEDYLYQSVIAGRILNVCSLWNINHLRTYGGDFDSEIGVEEIAPIIRMSRVLDDPFIAPVFPEGVEQLVMTPEEEASWRKRVMSDKEQRGLREAQRAGGTFEDIKAGILPGYPK